MTTADPTTHSSILPVTVRERCSCWPTARPSRARPSAPTRRRHRRGRVQHGAVRLPGGDHRPVLRRADHHLHLPAHRQLRRDRRRRREPPPVLPRRGRARPGPAAQQLAQRRATSTRSCARHGIAGHRRHRHPHAHPPHPRRRRHARRVRRRSTSPTRPRCSSRPPSAEPGTDGIDLVAEVTCADAVHGRRRARAAWSPTTSASSARSCATSARIATSRSCPRRTPAADVLARQPDGVFLSNGPGDPAAVPLRGRRHRAACSATCRCSASASATSCSARALGGATVEAARSATTAATTRCATSPPARIEITSQNHNFAVPTPTRSADAPRSPT